MLARRRTAGLTRDRDGALMLEFLVACTPVCLFFLTICQVIDLSAHQLIVHRAASAAVRAAVVVLPDDGRRYDDPRNLTVDQYVGGRKRAIEEAALTVLSSSYNFLRDSTKLTVTGHFRAGTPATVELTTDYVCLLAKVPLVCGLSGKRRLHASAELTYQGARYRYSEGG